MPNKTEIRVKNKDQQWQDFLPRVRKELNEDDWLELVVIRVGVGTTYMYDREDPKVWETADA